jgi:hypothetical protein
MTKTDTRKRLGGSPGSANIARRCALTLAIVAITGGSITGSGQAPPETGKPAEAAGASGQAPPETGKAGKQVANQQAPPAENAGKTIGSYLVHQEIELGGRIVVDKTGSEAMWATMVNQSTGLRVLNQFLDMHSLNPSKTPIFDTLTTSSFGYGGDPYDVTRLNFSKGRWYDFASSFRRDRNYFDYNLLVNSLLTTYTPTQPVLVPQPDSLHPFNTVRRNTDILVTILPLSIVSFRAGYNLGTHEGPTLTTLKGGGDVQLYQWFRNSLDSYVGGVDVKVAKRTTVSYDQFYTYYKGDSSNQLYGANYVIANGTPVSLGVDMLAGTTTCGSKAGSNTPATIGPYIQNGIINPYCSLTITQSELSPTRTSFPVEQLRFSSRYWNKVAFNGRYLYSGGTTNINSFNEIFNGYSRGNIRQTIETGAGPNGKYANNTRVNNNGDFSAEAQLTNYLSVSDVFTYWNMRTAGSQINTIQTWTGTSGSITPPIPATSALTPLNDPTITVTAPTTIGTAALNQKNIGNTITATVNATSEVKLFGGWRFNNRNITDPGDDLTWHQNWLLVGGVVQPSRAMRLNVNYDLMNSHNANSETLTNSFTREEPNKLYQLRARASLIPAKWIHLDVTGNYFWAKNTDPLVNHSEHNLDTSFGAHVIAMETLTFDVAYAYDAAYSVTDLCYEFTPNPNAPLPAGATNAGACTVANSPTNGASDFYLGNGYYHAPSNYFYGAINYAPSKYVRLFGGANVSSIGGSAEQLNPLMVPGALSSQGVSPFADVQVNVAKQWIWHGNWTHESYQESDGAGPAPRSFHGELVTLGVRWAF